MFSEFHTVVFCLSLTFRLSVYGLLLEPDHTLDPNGNKQYISLETFITEKKFLQQQIDQLRRENEQTLQVLAGQLKQKLSDLDGKIVQSNNQLASFRNDQNATFTNVFSQMTALQTRVSGNSMKVGITACVTVEQTFQDLTVKFPNIHSKVGISNAGVTAFQSTGKFICETTGLYFISAELRTNCNSCSYHLKKNDDIIAFGASAASPHMATNTISLVVEAQANDKLFVYAGVTVNADYSCLTVIKIK
ncbi:unnamed protein product [Mytilus edulis]|uniref:C1q domain-containing protein n=1 Tax=Mytilus edulis TaxID=6550 RepID=A0A8S3QT62_MYTED|nr:unnamed protein product [Mytilus edulis]